MDFEKYTDRARGFVQSAQGLALREGNQQFTPEHLLKVLIDDEEGLAAGLIARAGGRPDEVLQREQELRSAGWATRLEEETTCCYSVQTKVWVTDPDGNPWELYTILQPDAPRKIDPASSCCNP